MKGELLLEIKQGSENTGLGFFLIAQKGEVLQSLRAIISSRLANLPESFVSETSSSKIEKEKMVSVVNQVCGELIERYPEYHSKHKEALTFSEKVKNGLEAYLKNGKKG